MHLTSKERDASSGMEFLRNVMYSVSRDEGMKADEGASSTLFKPYEEPKLELEG